MNMNVTKTNGVKLLAVVAVLAMVVCAFAAVMPAEKTDAAPSNTQYYSGVLDSKQEFAQGTNVVINNLYHQRGCRRRHREGWNARD